MQRHLTDQQLSPHRDRLGSATQPLSDSIPSRSPSQPVVTPPFCKNSSQNRCGTEIFCWSHKASDNVRPKMAPWSSTITRSQCATSCIVCYLQCMVAFLTELKQDIRCVISLECTARCELSHATGLLKVLNQYPDRPLTRLG